MNLRGVYAITDEQLLAGDLLFSSVFQALEGGICLLQYRNKSADHQTRLTEATTLKSLCDKFNVPLIINDDLQLCLDSQADGLHIGQADTDLHRARSRLGSQAIIGVTCHNNLEYAIQAQDSGADYVAFGRFYPSVTKPDASPAELNILQQAKASLEIPVVAIGGINTENARSLITAGADMIAVINYLFQPDEKNPIMQRARMLTELFPVIKRLI